MNQENKIILAELKNHLINNYGSSIKDIILFGSQVRGDSRKFSDYDVLIILKNSYTGKDENRILDLCYDIDLKFDILLDVHIISEKELNSVRGRQDCKSGVYRRMAVTPRGEIFLADSRCVACSNWMSKDIFPRY